MSDKNEARLRRAQATRAKIAQLKAVRLTVHRSNTHIYAQVIDASGAKVLASASTAEREVRPNLAVRRQRQGRGGSRPAHRREGESSSALRKSRSTVRATSIHGRVKALAEAAREAGLKF